MRLDVFVSIPRIVESAYAFDPQGGPVSADVVVRTSVHRMRAKFREHDIRLVIEARHSCGYRLVRARSAQPADASNEPNGEALKGGGPS